MAEVLIKLDSGRYKWTTAPFLPGGPWVPAYTENETPTTASHAYAVGSSDFNNVVFLYEYTPDVAVLRASRHFKESLHVQFWQLPALGIWEVVQAILTDGEKKARAEWDAHVLSEQARA